MNQPILPTNQRPDLVKLLEDQGQKFKDLYYWLEKNMPSHFFEEVSNSNINLIVYSLMGFHLQEYFSTIDLKKEAIIVALDNPDIDLKILQRYANYGIKNYQTFVSLKPLNEDGKFIRISTIHFTQAIETDERTFPQEDIEKLRALTKERNPKVNDAEFDKLILGINNRFLRSLNVNQLSLALDMFFRAQTRDNCQYEVLYNDDWSTTGVASMQLVLAWRNCPKHNFLYRLARTIYRHKLVIKRVNATYIDPYSPQNILIMVISLDGINQRPAWDTADIPDFLREFVTVKYFASFDAIDQKLVSKNIITGTMANFLRAAINFVHQGLVHIDSNLYSMDLIEEAICRHPELTTLLCEAFKYKFDPHNNNTQTYHKIRDVFLEDVEKLDTGQEENDLRRKNVLKLAMNFIHYTLKTNFYRLNFTAFSFRLDPKYMDEIPFDRKKKFPELPYAIFFIKGMHFFGFHIRFKDLSRGGLRTVFPKSPEQAQHDRNNIFTECYNLAYTQHFKNKDIPEGGAKGVLFLQPFSRLESETLILKKELEEAHEAQDILNARLQKFREEQTLEYLYQAQRSYIESLITIVNCHPNGELRAKYIVDYWQRPEYLYLGPDENMHDSMINWIAWFSKHYDYKPKSTFISGKEDTGINHKFYGVTSLGVNVYMDAILRYLNIDPQKDIFTVKMSGGPDGDVAGNQIKNLYTFYHDTAKLVALVDVSGTIHDPKGLDIDIMYELFKAGKPIKYYPPEKLHNGGFLVDKFTKRTQNTFTQQTLCYKKINDTLVEEWLSGNEMNHLIRNNIHETEADIFIPAGGRPRTLNGSNVKDYLNEDGKPTSKAIVEGANLYLDFNARTLLEELGCLIIKDSSANKTGVICSSFEILCGLTLGDDRFVLHKATLVKEILERLKQCASNEAELLLKTHSEKKIPLTKISDAISRKINEFTYQILDYLDPITLDLDPNSPYMQCYLSYCLPLLRNNYQKELIEEIPDHHKKAIISCHIAAKLVYTKGLDWSPTIVDILPILV